MDDYLNSKEYLELKKVYDERQNFVKTGDNVVHLEYLGSFIDTDTINEIEKSITETGAEFSRFDYEGFPRASIEDYKNTIFIMLRDPLVTGILSGLASMIIWESVKFSIKAIRRNLKKSKYSQSESLSNKEVSLGIDISIDNSRSFKFRIKGDLSEQIVEKSLDKIIPLLKEEKKAIETDADNDHVIHDYFLTFNEETDLWEKVNILDEIRKEIRKNKK